MIVHIPIGAVNPQPEFLVRCHGAGNDALGICEVHVTLSEKVLYHQIHPAKLATDISAEIVSLYFLWQHELVLGLILHFVPPVVTSAVLVPFGNFEVQKHSRLGRYISWHMTRAIEAIRFAGDIVAVFGAWFRLPALIAGGLLIVLLAWTSGPLRRPPEK